MLRKIIKINEEKCSGCGLCADACHEGAIAMIDGKAKLVRDDYCDGLGDCLPACPENAISFEVREAAAYDADAVAERMRSKKQAAAAETACSAGTLCSEAPAAGCLSNWPVQIKLAPVKAPYFDGAHLLIAADCTAYTYGNFHEAFIKGRKLLVGCPKLDMIDYSEKLAEIIKNNDIKDITLTRMIVPCCGGLEYAVRQAISESGKDINLRIVTVGIEGDIVNDVTA